MKCKQCVCEYTLIECDIVIGTMTVAREVICADCREEYKKDGYTIKPNWRWVNENK